MEPAQGKHRGNRPAADCQHPRRPYSRGHGGGVRHGLRSVCAVRFSRAGDGVYPTGDGCAGHLGRGAAARAGPRRPRHRRRLRHADPGFLGAAGFLGAVSLSRRRHRRGIWSRAHPAVALACGHDHRVRDSVDLPMPAMRPVDDRAARSPRHRRIYPRGVAGGMRIRVRTAGGARPHRADLVRRARSLSVRRHHDRAQQFFMPTPR
jgi:hypothetical protein